jgi:hypothetical protein
MLYQRGTKQSYDQWAKLVEDKSYTFENLLPYFKKSVTFTPPDAAKRFPNATALYDASAFGSGGPLHVSYPNYASPWSRSVFRHLIFRHSNAPFTVGYSLPWAPSDFRPSKTSTAVAY